MNKELQEFARQRIKKGLALLPSDWQLTFRRMYAPHNLDRPIDEVVDNMPAEKLDWAMEQVSNSVRKFAKSQEVEA